MTSKKKPEAKEPMAKVNPAERVELREVATLVPYAQNSRIHSSAQVSQIASSIQQWGFTTAVLVDEAGMIIAGHGRVLAAQQLGLAKVPVMVAQGWTEDQKRAYLIADNKIALNASWDMEILQAEISALGEQGFEVGLLGFDVSEMSALFMEVQEGHTDPMEEWQGMPEYTNEDLTSYRQMIVHFADAESVEKFSQLIEQTITPKTKYLWFPDQVIRGSKGREFIDGTSEK
jgi:hypothetical protein